ncbi:MAG: polysaccharide deacetylase family protein [Rhodoferax sp.]|nr:polysaccharide deacetylase family protein [Rhodoferax sp.]
MPPVNKLPPLLRFAIVLIASCAYSAGAIAQKACDNPLYLTFDTGHMDVAPLVAEVLKRQNVKVTFFAANERTKVGDGSLGNHWAPWWKARAAEGHEFASHTYDHVYWRGDLPGVEPKFRMQPAAGALEGREFTWDAKKYCEEIAHANERLQDFTGKKPLPLFRAPGGKTSPRLLAVARSCGFEHVGWAAAGFLGDELPSEKFSNEALLKKALHSIKRGDILMAHLGIWSRKDPWAPTVLEPLIMGLKDKGFCFATLRDHPAYSARVLAAGSPPQGIR